MGKVRFQLNRVAARNQILAGNMKTRELLDETVDNALAIIQAQFFLTYGVEGKFKLKKFISDRATVMIVADDRRTGAILKAHPGWLDDILDTM